MRQRIEAAEGQAAGGGIGLGTRDQDQRLIAAHRDHGRRKPDLDRGFALRHEALLAEADARRDDLEARSHVSFSTKGAPSKASSPRPIAAMAAIMRPRRSSRASAIATSRAFGVALGEASRS